MRDFYHHRLDRLVGQLADACDLVAIAVGRATTALLNADEQLAERVIADDLLVDRARDRIEHEAQLLLALQAPVATDLRTIVTVVHSAENVERMGDLAHHVAVAVRRRHPRPVVPVELLARFRQMGETAGGLATAAGQVVRAAGLTDADTLRPAENEVDDLHRSLFAVIDCGAWRHGVPTAVDAVLLSRYYERFADHAVSVARRTAFVTGTMPAAVR